MAKQQQNVVGGFKAKPNLTELRNRMKYKVNTSSTTASGVVPIKGATKYPAEPSIAFTREAWVKQCHLVDKCSKEVGWFALVDYDPVANEFTISELVIPCQEVTGTETDIGKEDLADAAMELIEAGKDTSKMYAWFHSHVNMGVTPSAQDEYQVEDFLEDLADQPEVPAFIRGIQNKKGDLKLDVYFVQHGIAYQNVDFYVIHDDDPQWLTDIEGQIATKVTEKTYPTYGGYGGVYNPNKYTQMSDGGFGGNRHQAGKSGNAAERTAAIHDRYDDDYYYNPGFRAQTPWDYTYDEEDDGYVPVGQVDRTVDYDDSPRAPQAVTSPNTGYMETVYCTPEGVEVLLDTDNALWVCDEHGALYEYDDYTETYGEVGSPKKTVVVQ